MALTADVRSETLPRAINDGATDFLGKPFNAIEILIRVRNLLHARMLYLTLKDCDGKGVSTVRPGEQSVVSAALP